MNKLKLKITEQAKADITSIVEYIAKDNKTAAYAMAAYLYSVCQNLVGIPEIGTSRPDFTYKNYRFLTIKKRYIIAYRVEENILFVSRVLSAYQDICELL